MLKRCLFAGVLVLLIAFASASAELVFEETELKNTAKASESGFTAAYAFENEGDNAVKILKLDTSCGCTVPKLDKLTYAPGETGRIEATFTYGDRTGEQLKTITVKTDDPDQPEIKLRLSVFIPPLATFEPRALTIAPGDASKHTLTLTLQEGVTAKVTAARLERGNARIEIKPLEEGRRYALEVTPADPLKMGTYPLIVETDSNADRLKKLTVYLRVTPTAAGVPSTQPVAAGDR